MGEGLSIGILGAGRVGTAVARQAIRGGHSVRIATSKPADEIRLLTEVIVPGAQAVDREALRGSDIIVAAVPLHKYRSIAADVLQGHIVIDTMNYWAPVDGVMDEFEERHRPLRSSPSSSGTFAWSRRSITSDTGTSKSTPTPQGTRTAGPWPSRATTTRPRAWSPSSSTRSATTPSTLDRWQPAEPSRTAPRSSTAGTLRTRWRRCWTVGSPRLPKRAWITARLVR
ncbi:NAD(P)-binding domain-containing protein [Nesterenkonia pannonica]|uniref:NADPH-dependent F420 reductase n=1 Tax=Nesterenkonia pannonica TaxID=1548602 RepID=UPI002164ADCF|nr:NAD(P)-binding domain-containing protein [Nesterenkonia pannonica]